MMDRYLATHTPEAQAYNYISQNSQWERDEADMNEMVMALCASYNAFARYLKGEDLFLLPRNVDDLERTLFRYAHDAIHNIISHSKAPLAYGGYRRICTHAERSVREVLANGRNAEDLLAQHCEPNEESVEVAETHARRVATI